jgi:hypothetical protein
MTMNKLRRKQLAKAVELMEQAMAILEAVKDEEQEAFDNLPESIQYGQQGEQMEENISTMEEHFDNLSEAIEALSEI